MKHNPAPMYGGFPGRRKRGEPMEQLKQRPIWICCKIAEVKGRKTKIPCAAKGGATGTSKEYAHTWVTYDETVAAMKKNEYAGV